MYNFKGSGSCQIVSYGSTEGGPQDVGMLGDITGDTPDVFLATEAPAAAPAPLLLPLELFSQAPTLDRPIYRTVQ